MPSLLCSFAAASHVAYEPFSLFPAAVKGTPAGAQPDYAHTQPLSE